MPIERLTEILARSRVPGLTAGESAVAMDFLRAHGAEYDTADFNVRLGHGVELPVGLSPAAIRAAEAALPHRADILLRQGDGYTIVEVKVRVLASVMGQLQAYRALWWRFIGQERPVSLMAVGRTVDPLALSVLQDAGVDVRLFPSGGVF